MSNRRQSTAHRAVEPCEKCGEIHPKCTAHSKRSGKPCGRSPMPGQTVCNMHGGAEGRAQELGLERVRRQELLDQAKRELDAAGIEDKSAEEHLESALMEATLQYHLYQLAIERLEREPGALTGSIGYYEEEEDEQGHKRYELRVQSEDPTLTLDRHGAAQVHPFYQLRDSWADRRVKIAKDCVTIGISKRRVQIQEAQQKLVAEAFRSALADPELNLPLETQRAAVRVLGKHLRQLPSGG